MWKICVIGASTFIGQAFIAKMLEQGHQIVVAHDSSLAPHSSNLFPDQPNLSNLKLDLFNSQELLLHISDCNYVVHFPSYYHSANLWEQLELATRAAQSLLQACVEAQVKKFIHISSTTVYGDPPPSEVITESSPYLASLCAETSILQAIEKLILEVETGETEVVVLQPSLVYGPGDGGETSQRLSQMKTAFIPLPRHGAGYCNPIYIDDVVTAIIRACETPNLHRQRFIICSGHPVSWKEFLSSYELILGEKSLVNLPVDYFCEPQDSISLLQELSSKILKKRKVMEGTSAIAKALYGKSIHYLSTDEFRTMVAQPIYSNQNSRDHLNFQPETSLSVGIDKIRQWWHQQSIGTL